MPDRCTLTHLVPTATQYGAFYHYPRFTEEGNETQRDEVTRLSLHSLLLVGPGFRLVLMAMICYTPCRYTRAGERWGAGRLVFKMMLVLRYFWNGSLKMLTPVEIQLQALMLE